MRREGGDDRTRVTPEMIRSYVGSKTVRSSHGVIELARMISAAPSREYVVESIKDERGKMVNGTKQIFSKVARRLG